MTLLCALCCGDYILSGAKWSLLEFNVIGVAPHHGVIFPSLLSVTDTVLSSNKTTSADLLHTPLDCGAHHGLIFSDSPRTTDQYPLLENKTI